jgi:glutaryl-CoA dehydrogenase
MQKVRQVCARAHATFGGNGILLGYYVTRHYANIEAVYTYEGTDTAR